MVKTTKSTWQLKAEEILPAEMVAREPRLAGLEENPVYRLIRWRQRVAPVELVASKNGGGCFWQLFGLICLLPGLVIPWSFGAGLDPFFALVIGLLVVVMLVARFYKPKVSLRDSKSALPHVPGSILYDLLLTGYPVEEIAAGVWGSGIRPYQWTGKGIVIGGVGIVAIILVLGLASKEAACFAWIATCGIIGVSLGVRGIEIEFGLRSRVSEIAEERPDLKIRRRMNLRGCLVAIALGGLLGSLLILISRLGLPSPEVIYQKAGKMQDVLLFAICPLTVAVMGFAGGWITRAIIVWEHEMQYEYLIGYVRKIMEEIREACESEG